MTTKKVDYIFLRSLKLLHHSTVGMVADAGTALFHWLILHCATGKEAVRLHCWNWRKHVCCQFFSAAEQLTINSYSFFVIDFTMPYMLYTCCSLFYYRLTHHLSAFARQNLETSIILYCFSWNSTRKILLLIFDDFSFKGGWKNLTWYITAVCSGNRSNDSFLTT